MKLPPGFVLDEPNTNGNLPPGFVIDSNKQEEPLKEEPPTSDRGLNVDILRGALSAAFPNVSNTAKLAEIVIKNPKLLKYAPLASAIALPLAAPAGASALLMAGLAGAGGMAGKGAEIAGKSLLGENVSPSAAERAKDVLVSGAKEGLSQAAGEKLVKPLAKGAGWMARRTGKGLAKVAQAITGVRATEFARLAKDPSALYKLETLETAGKKLGDALKEEGISTAPSAKELFDTKLSVAKRTGKEVFDKIANGEEVTAEELLRAKRATSRIIANTSWRDRETLKSLVDFYTKLNEEFGKVGGRAAKASKEYARSALASSFRKVFPVLKSGDPSVFRMFAPSTAAGLAAGGMATGGATLPAVLAVLAASSPLVAGTATTAAGASYKLGKLLLSNPSIRQAISSYIASEIQGKPENE